MVQATKQININFFYLKVNNTKKFFLYKINRYLSQLYTYIMIINIYNTKGSNYLLFAYLMKTKFHILSIKLNYFIKSLKTINLILLFNLYLKVNSRLKQFKFVKF